MNKINRNRTIFGILCIAAILIGVILLCVLVNVCPELLMLFAIYVLLAVVGLLVFNYYLIKKPFKEIIIPEIL